MATHNGKNTIEYAIESIIKQTEKNWKFVICDDASTDGTFEFLKSKYGNRKEFILIKNSTNKGLAESLNLCIQQCLDAEFIARMDDDDISYPNRFAIQIKYLKDNPNISFVSSSADIYNGFEIIKTRVLKNFPQKSDLIWNSPFIHPATIFRTKDLIKANFYRISEDTKRGQDYDLFMRMYGMGLLGGNVQVPLFRYTENTKTAKRRTFNARIGEVKIRVKGYKEMNILIWAFPFTIKPMFAYLKDLIKNLGMKFSDNIY